MLALQSKNKTKSTENPQYLSLWCMYFLQYIGKAVGPLLFSKEKQSHTFKILLYLKHPYKKSINIHYFVLDKTFFFSTTTRTHLNRQRGLTVQLWIRCCCCCFGQACFSWKSLFVAKCFFFIIFRWMHHLKKLMLCIETMACTS